MVWRGIFAALIISSVVGATDDKVLRLRGSLRPLRCVRGSCARPSVCAAALRIVAPLLIFGASPAPSALRTIQPDSTGIPHFPIFIFPYSHITFGLGYGYGFGLWYGLWFGYGYLRFELWLREARRKSRPHGRRAGFPFARRNEREKTAPRPPRSCEISPFPFPDCRWRRADWIPPRLT